MDETPARDEAIRCYVAGERPAAICHALGYSTPWLYTWLKREHPAHLAWAETRSRAPLRLDSADPTSGRAPGR
jgi:hypothetical protein